MRYLLDVNFIVAMFDSAHVNHDSAHAWFGSMGMKAWATCPITENGCVRVLSNPSYPTVTATPNEVAGRLAEFCSQPSHELWPDDISLLTDFDESAKSRLMGHQQITDYYLAALAFKHGGRLATFDGSLARSLAGTDIGKSIEIAG